MNLRRKFFLKLSQTFNVIVDFSAFSNPRRKPRENGPDSVPKQTKTSLDTNPADQPFPLHESTDASVPDRIQILDLHTSNPLISYQSQLYTCDWNTTIGTDMILSSTAQGPSSPLLFTTRHKLVARPARLTPNVGTQSTSPASPPTSPTPPDPSLLPNTLINQPTSSTTKSPKPAPTPLDTRASLVRQRQTAFLERLTAAKVARGETDQVTMHSQRRFTGTSWRSRQKQAATEEAEADNLETGFSAEEENGGGNSSQGRNETSRRAKIGRPRGQGRGRGRGQYRASLFENPRPDSGDILNTANPNASSTKNVGEAEGPPPQQVGQLADQHDIISTPPAHLRADQDQGVGSSTASVQAPMEATEVGEDVIMQDS